jgi:hypothetical protein
MNEFNETNAPARPSNPDGTFNPARFSRPRQLRTDPNTHQTPLADPRSPGNAYAKGLSGHTIAGFLPRAAPSMWR